jgi:hypothetical protein
MQSLVAGSILQTLMQGEGTDFMIGSAGLFKKIDHTIMPPGAHANNAGPYRRHARTRTALAILLTAV